MLKKARQFGAKDLFAKAQAIEMEACELIDEYKLNGKFK